MTLPTESPASSETSVDAAVTVTTASTVAEDTIDVVSVDDGFSDVEHTENGRPVRKRKATVPFDEDTEMDTDDLLDVEVVKPKKKPGPKPASNVKAPRKTTKKKGSAFSDDEDNGNLARQYPDSYWKSHAESKTGMINKINEDHPIQLVTDAHIHDAAPITGMVLSPDGTMLATFCNLGSAKVWSLEDYSLLKTLRDANEEHIDEFYVGTFTPDQTMLLVGGKRKDRNNWSEADEDNNILPCPLKIFDILSGKVVSQLQGHTEELLCVKMVQFKGENYYLSGSQDVSFVPNTGNKYFLAAADENLRLYDFEHATLLQTFENMYSSYCDCGKFIHAVDYPYPMPIPELNETPVPEVTAESNVKKGKMKAEEVAPVSKPQQFAYFISRGVELLDSEERMIAKDYNSCTLHKLVYPDTKGGKWYLTEVKRFQDEEYFSNAWLIKIASNGRYMLAPTCTGEVFIYNLKTGQVTGILKDHEDGQVKVYTYKNEEDLAKAAKDAAETAEKESEAEKLVMVSVELQGVSVKDQDAETAKDQDIEIDEDLTE
ncbi:hypothetical protein BGZ94_000476 [Podila epigama]|nr:hypothetical protein BGZ94_000476 [Podila epigama]